MDAVEKHQHGEGVKMPRTRHGWVVDGVVVGEQRSSLQEEPEKDCSRCLNIESQCDCDPIAIAEDAAADAEAHERAIAEQVEHSLLATCDNFNALESYVGPVDGDSYSNARQRLVEKHADQCDCSGLQIIFDI